MVDNPVQRREALQAGTGRADEKYEGSTPVQVLTEVLLALVRHEVATADEVETQTKGGRQSEVEGNREGERDDSSEVESRGEGEDETKTIPKPKSTPTPKPTPMPKSNHLNPARKSKAAFGARLDYRVPCENLSTNHGT